MPIAQRFINMMQLFGITAEDQNGAPDKTADYNVLNTGLQNALATYATNPSVKAGPNLFTQFGAALPFWLESDNTTRVHLTDRGQEIAASYIAPILAQYCA